MATRLTKYHGLGNDFLVLEDRARTGPYDPATVAALCDRHRGIGADGVLRLSGATAGGDLAMELRNADGGVAETSGNGLRCAVLAAAHAGLLGAGALAGEAVVVETLAGPVRARLAPGPATRPGDGTGRGGAPSLAEVAVEMGVARVEPLEASPVAGRRASRVEVGNPHLVLLGGPTGEVDLARLGPGLEASRPGRTNVEVVASAGGHLELVVWERGAGLTQACGSGSCAAAAAARAAGEAGDSVRVRNPGGDLLVELSGPALAPHVTLTGPACRVGEVLVDLADLAASVGAPA